MTTSTTTSAGTAIRAVFAQTSRAWADGDGQAFAAWYAPGTVRILRLSRPAPMPRRGDITQAH